MPRNEPINETSTKIFVGGLPPSVTTKTLRETFAEFGTVTIAEVMLDRDQISRGFGFVTFENPDVVTRLVAKKRVEIDGKAVEVKRAEPRGTLPGGRGGGGGGRGPRSYDRDDYGSRDYGGYDRGGARGGARDYGGSRGYSDYGLAAGIPMVTVPLRQLEVRPDTVAWRRPVTVGTPLLIIVVVLRRLPFRLDMGMEGIRGPLLPLLLLLLSVERCRRILLRLLLILLGLPMRSLRMGILLR